MMRQTVVAVVACLLFVPIFIACGGEPSRDPDPIMLDGRPVSSFFAVNTSLDARAKAQGKSVKEFVADNARIRSLGHPIGRGDIKKLKTFKHVCRDLQPGSVKSVDDVIKAVAAVRTELQQASVDVGRPFLLIGESTSGWLLNEQVRACVPVLDTAALPAGIVAGAFEGRSVLLASDRVIPQDGNLDAMDRWAEQVLTPLTPDGELDFSGPFLLRFTSDELPTEGPIMVDWIIPAPATVQSAQGAAGVEGTQGGQATPGAAANPGARVE